MPTSINSIGKISKLEYALMFLVICISGNPLFIYTESKLEYVAFVSIMFILCYVKRKNLLNQNFIFWLVCSLLLFLFQGLILELTSKNANINFIARLYIAFLSASFFGYKFREIYFKVMVVVCAISIPFYILQYIGITPGVDFGRYKTLLFFNSIRPHVFEFHPRNSGMFWEPGAFQGFIMLVPLLYSDKLKQLWEMHKKDCIILLIALLTTQSTTGYITFVLFMFLAIIINKSFNLILKFFLITLIVAISFYAWSQDFMGEKFMMQYDEAMSLEKGDVSWNRMGAMLIDFENILRHPIIGNGFMDDSRYGILGEYMRGTGNGFSGAINMFGIPFMLLYFIGVFKNLKYLPLTFRYLFIFIIILILNGEYMLNYPFFWALLFVKIPSIKCYKLSETNKNYNIVI